MINVKAIILAGDGLNCENETAKAFQKAGAEASIIHINDLLDRPFLLMNYHILAIPGGFSFGDEISSGQILALKLKHGLENELKEFAKTRLIIGICNGFQTLTKLGLLPFPEAKRAVTLTQNRSHQFINSWVQVKLAASKSPWLKGLPQEFNLPIRHAEGRVVFKGNEHEQKELFQKMKEHGQIALTYENDINGSYAKIAGLTDKSGRIFGLMPHPEAATSQILEPISQKKCELSLGQIIFNNAVEYIRESHGQTIN